MVHLKSIVILHAFVLSLGCIETGAFVADPEEDGAIYELTDLSSQEMDQHQDGSVAIVDFRLNLDNSRLDLSVYPEDRMLHDVELREEAEVSDAWIDDAAPDVWIDATAPDAWIDATAPDAWVEDAAPDAWVEDAAPDAWVEDATLDGALNDAHVEPPDRCEACDPHAECVDGVCVCLEGWRGDGARCEEIDECFEDARACSLTQERCINEEGGYQCVCREGLVYSMDEGGCIVPPAPKSSLAMNATLVCWRFGEAHFCAERGDTQSRQMCTLEGYYHEHRYCGGDAGIGDRYRLGRNHVCTLDGARAVCWGSVTQGQTFAPDDVDFSAVVAGSHFSCGLGLDGALRCWGSDTYGRATPPEGRFEDLMAGPCSACAAREDGRLACWGCGMDTPSRRRVSV